MPSPGASPPASPDSPMDPPLMMVPRTKVPRRHPPSSSSRTPARPSSTSAGAAAGASAVPTPSKTKTRRSSSSTRATAGPSSSTASSASLSANDSTRSMPLTTPSTSTLLTSQPSTGGAGVRARRKSSPGSGSNTDITGLVPPPSSHGGPSAQVASIAATPSTGAGRMAAAAKRGNAGLSFDHPGGPGAGAMEDEDHPLSEKCLRARDYQTIHTLNRLFHLPSRWRLVRPLGQGAYGLVIQISDSLSGAPVAVKCITRVFDKVILARRALREITLLRHFGEHANLTALIDLDNVWEGYNEIYLYMEPMEADLHQIIRSGQELTNGHIEFFTYQLLRGMKYIHSANVIHRDLKPGNLLVNADCELKICDFGLARGFQPVEGEEAQGEELRLTEYVATRWYRAPEIMLSNKRYTTAIDVWSIGCILGELLGGKPMFQGKDYVSQLDLILEMVGTPDEATVARMASQKAGDYMRTLPLHPPRDLAAVFPKAPSDAIDLLVPLLAFDPSQRLTVAQALETPYMQNYHSPTDEPDCHALFDKWKMVESLQTIEELKAAITREIEEYRQEVRQVFAPDTDDAEGEEGAEGNADGDEDAEMVSAEAPIPEGETLSTNAANSSPSIGAPSGSRKRPHADMGLSPRSGGPGALSPLSEDAPVPRSARSSRRSSGNSVHSRRAASFLFSSPLGGGMTPLPSLNAAASGGPGAPGVPAPVMPAAGSPGDRDRDSLSSGTTSTSAHWMRPTRSRAPSGAGVGNDFASLRPLIRQLSAIGIERDREGHASLSVVDGRGAGGIGVECPPMSVSPHDAPPSEHPKSFGQPSRPPSAPPALPDAPGDGDAPMDP